MPYAADAFARLLEANRSPINVAPLHDDEGSITPNEPSGPMNRFGPLSFSFEVSPTAEREKAPIASGVYRLCTAQRWVYVGESDNIRQSLFRHLYRPKPPEGHGHAPWPRSVFSLRLSNARAISTYEEILPVRRMTLVIAEYPAFD